MISFRIQSKKALFPYELVKAFSFFIMVIMQMAMNRFWFWLLGSSELNLKFSYNICAGSRPPYLCFYFNMALVF